MNKRLKCGCGEILSVPESAQGKQISCPACLNSITVPSFDKGKTAKNKPFVNKPTENKPKKESDSPQKADPQAEPCPGCGEPFPIEKSICQRCRYSRRLKKKLKETNLEQTHAKKKKPKKETKPKKKKSSSTTEEDSETYEVLVMSIGGTIVSLIWLCTGLTYGYIYVLPAIILPLSLLGLLFSCSSMLLGFFSKDE